MMTYTLNNEKKAIKTMENANELTIEEMNKVTGGADEYIGQLIEVAFDFAPYGFLMCNGAIYSISQYPALFSLIKNKYGGDGVNTFAVPNKPGYCICVYGIYPTH